MLLDIVLIFNDATAELAAASVRVSSLCTSVQWVTLSPGHSRWQGHPRSIWYLTGGMHFDLSQPSCRLRPFQALSAKYEHVEELEKILDKLLHFWKRFKLQEKIRAYVCNDEIFASIFSVLLNVMGLATCIVTGGCRFPFFPALLNRTVAQGHRASGRRSWRTKISTVLSYKLTFSSRLSCRSTLSSFLWITKNVLGVLAVARGSRTNPSNKASSGRPSVTLPYGTSFDTRKCVSSALFSIPCSGLT